MTSLFKLSGLAGLFPESKLFSKYHLGYLNENVNHEVDVLAGAFMMIPKKIIDIVGSFDEDFFMYGEDIDLSYRIQKAGYKNFYFAETCIIHFKGESTKKGSLNYVKLFYKAMSVFVKKHYGNSAAGLYNFLLQTAIIFRGSVSAISRMISSGKNFFRHKKYIHENSVWKNKEIIIAGTALQCNDVTELLHDVKFKKIICLPIGKSQNEDVLSDEVMTKIKDALGLYPASELIFCQGAIAFKTIINLVQNLPAKTGKHFYFSGAESVISSSL